MRYQQIGVRDHRFGFVASCLVDGEHTPAQPAAACVDPPYHRPCDAG
jgi:hypothetical protein